MKCKVGDVAVITKGIPDNIGRLVLVVKFYGDFDYAYLGYGVLPCWTVESMGGLLKTSIGPDIGGFIPDLALRPIDDLKVSQSDLAQARAEAELKAAWENLANVCREAEREGILQEKMARCPRIGTSELLGNIASNRSVHHK